MEEITTKQKIILEETFGYENLLLELKGYSAILDAIQYVANDNLPLNFELVNYVISKRVDFICDCLQKYA